MPADDNDWRLPTEPVVVAEQEDFRPGEELVLIGESHFGQYCAVFEDDGETGWFYGHDLFRPEEKRIVDVLHIYNVRDVVDRERPGRVQVIWSTDGLKVGLFLEWESPRRVRLRRTSRVLQDRVSRAVSLLEGGPCLVRRRSCVLPPVAFR
jgi:hypothetical protein